MSRSPRAHSVVVLVERGRQGLHEYGNNYLQCMLSQHQSDQLELIYLLFLEEELLKFLFAKVSQTQRNSVVLENEVN